MLHSFDYIVGDIQQLFLQFIFSFIYVKLFLFIWQ